MKIILFVATGILVGLIFSYPEIKKLVLIYRTPIRRIRKLPASGQVQVFGKADGKNTKSIFKHTNCCLCRTVIKEDRGRRKGYVTIYSDMSTEPFDLVDGTDRIRVFPANAQLMLRDDFSKANDSLTPLPPRIDEFIRSMGIPTTDFLGLQRLFRVSEQIIKPGDDLFILGEVMQENGAKVIKSGTGLPFIISDHKDYDVISTLFQRVVGKIIAATIFVVIFLSSIKPI